jgi:hypothetical protein
VYDDPSSGACFRKPGFREPGSEGLEMISRFVAEMSALPLVRLLGIKASAESPYRPTSDKSADAEDFTTFVKIAIGTGGRGHTYPGPQCRWNGAAEPRHF